MEVLIQGVGMVAIIVIAAALARRLGLLAPIVLVVHAILPEVPFACLTLGASRAARKRLEAHADGAPPGVVNQLRDLTERRSNWAWKQLGGPGRETPSQAYARLRRVMLDAERRVFRATATRAGSRGGAPPRPTRHGPGRVDGEPYRPTGE